jgi:hypothetical protein
MEDTSEWRDGNKGRWLDYPIRDGVSGDSDPHTALASVFALPPLHGVIVSFLFTK